MIAALKATLADLYPDEASARRLASDAGLRQEHIVFGGKAINFWSNVVEMAVERNRLAALVELAAEPYPENIQLQRVLGALEYSSLNLSDDNDEIMAPNHGDLDRRLAVLESRLEGHIMLVGSTWERHEKDHTAWLKRYEREREDERGRYMQFRSDMKVWVMFSALLNGAIIAGGAGIIYWMLNNVVMYVPIP